MGLGAAFMKRQDHRDFVLHVFGEHGATFGMIADKGQRANPSLVGAVGCSVQAFCTDALRDVGKDPIVRSPPVIGIYGGWRFIVKEVVAMKPYPVVLVDELFDDRIVGPSAYSMRQAHSHHDPYLDKLQPTALMNVLFSATRAHVDQRLQSMGPHPSTQYLKRARLLDYLTRTIYDLCPTLEEKCLYACLLAMDLVNLPNDKRRRLLAMTDGMERMRLLLVELYEQSPMSATGPKKNTFLGSDTDKMPLSFSQYVWTFLFEPGTRIEYYMDDMHWCEGTIASPLDFVSDCAMVTVFVPSLGEPRRLLISYKESTKWRFLDHVTPPLHSFGL